MKKITLLLGILMFSISCQDKSDNSDKFKIISSNISLENTNGYEKNHINWDEIGTEKFNSKEFILDAYILNLDLSIKNLTGEKIDNADVSVFLELQFKSKNIRLYLGKRGIYEGLDYLTWNENEINDSSSIYILNDNSNFNRTLFIHSPEKVTIKYTINAGNSVGLNINDLVLEKKDITSEWKKLETKLKN